MDILFQPDLSYSIDLYTNYPSQYVATKTIAEIIEMCNALTPCDSVIIHKKGGENGYSAVVPLKIGSRSLYHVGSNPLYDVSNKHVILWEYISGIYAGYFYAYDISHNFIRYNSASFSTKTIDNIEYYYDADGRADDYPPIMYITTDIEHLLINDTSSPNSGGAGSGYIGNSLLSNKKMVGYNVPTSSTESTKTESVNEASESPVSGKPKIGNGYAKIKLIKEAPVPPSNYIAWLDPEFGVNNLVISKPLQATNVKVVEDYYVADTSSSWSSFIVIPVGIPFTSDIDLIIDLDVYVGNEDNENSTDYGFELYFNLSRNNNRLLGMTMRNSRWASGANINYDIWGNTDLHSVYSVFDNTNNNYKWVNLKVVLGFRSGQWVSSKSYIDDTLFKEYTYSGKNMGNNDIDNIETALPANACTYRIKSYKIYTQTPS